MKIARRERMARIEALLGEFPIVGLVGARQVGKTTLARDLADNTDGAVAFLDLENPRDLARLESPMLALERLRGLVVLDEIQRRPDLFPVLRVLADRTVVEARFLVLGSASPGLLRQTSETLAGRIAYLELGGFDLEEVGLQHEERLWLRGGFPPSFLAQSEDASSRWRDAFVRTYLERELGSLGIGIPAAALRRFWTMLAHYHGQVWNGAELARAFGVSEKTVRRYLDVLCSTFMVRQLQPWHENVSKRQVKSPKVYIADSGVLHTLLGLSSFDDLQGHPKVGASWEGFALGGIVAALRARPEECYFWALHSGAELDLLFVRGTRRLGFEFKYTDAPRRTRSMISATRDLRLEQLLVVYPGEKTFGLSDTVRAVCLRDVRRELSAIV